MTDLPAHWNRVYARREDTLSWYQTSATTSLRMLERAGVGTSAKVIDIGGGTSRLVDALVDLGYEDPTVLDISSAAIEQSQRRLGHQARHVRWLVQDITSWQPDVHYDVWHDRAVFHFLTDTADRNAYRDSLQQATTAGSICVIATFAPGGPTHCSGLEVVRYDPAGIVSALGPLWKITDSVHENHLTPGGTHQPFTWALLRRS